MKLDHKQLGDFSRILRDAFTVSTFDQMLLYELGINRENIGLGSTFDEIIFNVLKEFQRREITTDLIGAAGHSNTDHQNLFQFAQRIGVAPAIFAGKRGALARTSNQLELERQIKSSNSLLDIAQWSTRIFEVEHQVCRIEIKANGDTFYGTGFLVGVNSVLTNYHVLEFVIGEQVKPDRVLFRFDYKVMADGTTINSGNIYRLAKQNWLIDHSEYSAVDELVDAGGALPEPDKLDYALVSLDGAPGDSLLSVGSNSEGRLRGWIEVKDEVPSFDPDTALLIVQHPQGDPLKLAIDSEAIIGVNSNRTRVRYRTNTEEGSSGSPCFNASWDLVALHHSGDPNFDKLHKAEYNEGIPIDMIRSLLKERGKESNLQTPP
ncbi:MAG: trypsin-like peptidase domain-containing protein [Pyrinomonadaceae bacterium]